MGFIPGACFKVFLKERDKIPLLTNFINQIIRGEVPPQELTLGRLFCLYKDASEPGSVENIRPIVITGVITKIIEYPILAVLKKIKLNRGQIGFKERMGTEVNIIRLRQILHNLQYDKYNRKSKMPKRFNKLLAKRIPIPVINL